MKAFCLGLTSFVALSSVSLHAYWVSLVIEEKHEMKFEYSADENKYRQTSNVTFSTFEAINEEGNKDKKESVNENVLGIHKSGHSLATIYKDGNEISLSFEVYDAEASFSYAIKIPVKITKGSWADFENGKTTEFVATESGCTAYERAFDEEILPMMAPIFDSHMRRQLIKREPKIEHDDLLMNIKTTMGNFSFVNLKDMEHSGIHIIANKQQLEVNISQAKYSIKTMVDIAAP